MKGYFASYRKIDNIHGIKTFADANVCRNAFEAQKKAYKLGYATKPIKLINENEILMENACQIWTNENLESGIYYHKEYKEMADALLPIMMEIRGKTRKRVSLILDFRKENLGIYKNKIVNLDYS